MNQKTTLSIKTPCSEKFDNFLLTEKGSFCSSCQKEVIDFRNWTDNEVASHFKNATQKTCGYFRAEQLKAYDNDAVYLKTNSYKFWNVGLASVSLLSLLSFNSAFGQTKEKPSTIQTQNKNKKVKQVEEQSEGIIVKGIVSDEIGPLPNVSIIVKGTNVSKQTNFDGEFTLLNPLKKGDILLVSYIGYKTKEIVVSDSYISILLDEYDLVLMGEVAVSRVYQSKPSFFQRVKTWFKND